MVGAQSHSTSINTNNAAQPIWSKEINPRELFGSRIADVTIRYDAAALEPALAK